MKLDNKNILLKSGFSIAVIVIIFFNIGMILNLILNKQYVVKELTSSFKAISIERMEKIINNDYVGMFYYLLINSFLLIIMLIIIIRKEGSIGAKCV